MFIYLTKKALQCSGFSRFIVFITIKKIIMTVWFTISILLKSVSYTHLDVYKRQHQKFSISSYKIKICERKDIDRMSHMPFSYLDCWRKLCRNWMRMVLNTFYGISAEVYEHASFLHFKWKLIRAIRNNNKDKFRKIRDNKVSNEM